MKITVSADTVCGTLIIYSAFLKWSLCNFCYLFHTTTSMLKAAWWWCVCCMCVCYTVLKIFTSARPEGGVEDLVLKTGW